MKMEPVLWKAAKLDDLGFVGRGKSRHRPRNDSSLYGGTYPFFQTGDIKAANFHLTNYSQTYNEKGLAQSKLWNPGTLCITIAANIAESAILGIGGCFPDSVVGFVADPIKADVRFIKYYMEILKLQMQSVSRGTTQDNLSLDKLLTFDFRIPPLPIQQRIADILFTYDDLIENCQRRIKILETMARALYREWFVEYRYPGHEKMATTTSANIPKGWGVTTLNEFILDGSINLQTGPFGTQLKASQYTDEGTPVINVRNIGLGKVRSDKLEFLPDERVEEHKRHRLQSGDIVFGRKGAVERHLLVCPNEEGWIQGSDCIRMRIFKGPLTPEFLSMRFREEDHQKWMKNQCSGAATMASLNQDVLGRIPLTLPPESLFSAFGIFVRPALEQIDLLTSKCLILRKTRDLLLPRLLSGQLLLSSS